jgi:transposase
MFSDSEPGAAVLDNLATLGQGSDRQQAQYYRSMHARAVQRQEQWKQRALVAEQIIEQLLFLLGWCVQQIQELKRKLAWLNKQQFGSKSEATKSSGAITEQPPASASDPALGIGAAPATAPTKRKRGQQPGSKGPKRRRRVNLPQETTHHILETTERTCPLCGKIRPETGLTEESQQIEWKVSVVCHRHIRHRYGPSCDCPPGQGIVTAPKPAKLIPKGLFAVSFWVQVLLKKFDFQQPLTRIVRELKAHDLEVSPGTLTGGLHQIHSMIQPLVGEFVLHAREGSHWQMDETRWPLHCLFQDGSRQRWWAWVVVHPDATVFLLEPTRSGRVPEDFFPKGTEGIVNADRYAGYFGLLGADWKIQLAYCWSHQRRDFVNLGEGCPRYKSWADQWVGSINRLFAANRPRRQAWMKKQVESFGPLDEEVRRQVQQIRERLDRELAGGQLAPAQEKILRSMRRHWQGLTVFVDHAQVPMDNNAAERALRALAVARKNFYGSAAPWSGELALGCFTILATLRQHGICPRRYFQEYLQACACQGGKAPANLEPWLPWKWSPEKKAAGRTAEQAP